jgi:hypothetical protein
MGAERSGGSWNTTTRYLGPFGTWAGSPIRKSEHSAHRFYCSPSAAVAAFPDDCRRRWPRHASMAIAASRKQVAPRSLHLVHPPSLASPLRRCLEMAPPYFTPLLAAADGTLAESPPHHIGFLSAARFHAHRWMVCVRTGVPVPPITPCFHPVHV